MSVSGIDFGNLSLLIAQTSKGGVDVILNDSSNRQTATAVSIQGKQRFIGDSGAALARTNLTNTITNMKLLVGRKFDDPEVQKELSKAPFKAVKMAHGGVGISILYNDEQLVVSAEHFLAIMLVKAKEISMNANSGVNLADAVLAVPFWFTQAQRRGILQACEIAQVNCLKVANESTMVALSYGIFKSAKKLFSETEPMHTMFIDVGYAGSAVTVVDFIQEQMVVRATVSDGTVGGRDFDDVIIAFLVEAFKAKTGIDVGNNKKAILKLQAAAEKAKKTLSPAGVNEATVSVECLAEDRDLNALLTREEFEKRVIAVGLMEKLQTLVLRGVAEAGLAQGVRDLAEVEVVGGSTRINLVKKTLGEVLQLDAAALNYGLKTTMNADEAVCRGAALQCAMLSVRVKVKPFAIIDRLNYGIEAVFEANGPGAGGATGAMDEGEEKDGSEELAHSSGSSSGGSSGGLATVSLFQRGEDVPHKPRRITFRNKTADFSITLQYDAESNKQGLPLGESRFLAKYTIKVPSASPSATSSEVGDIRATFALDKSGLVFLQSAQLMEEVPATPAAPEAEGKEGGEAASATAASAAPLKKRYRKVDLKVEVEEPGLTRDQVKEALELEASMAFEDKLIQETADKRNELESYIYSMRDRIDGQLKSYGSKQEKEELGKKLTHAEDWLYNEGFDSTKGEYSRKIDELRAIGDKMEYRSHQATQRTGAVEALKKQLDLCKGFAANYDEAHAHITDDERDRIRKEVQATEAWLYDLLGKQEELASFMDPVCTTEVIQNKRNALFNATNPIMIKPKPKPEPTPAPAQSQTPPPPQPPTGGAGADAKAEECKGEDNKGQEAGAESKGQSESGPMEGVESTAK